MAQSFLTASAGSIALGQQRVKSLMSNVCPLKASCCCHVSVHAFPAGLHGMMHHLRCNSSAFVLSGCLHLHSLVRRGGALWQPAKHKCSAGKVQHVTAWLKQCDQTSLLPGCQWCSIDIDTTRSQGLERYTVPKWTGATDVQVIAVNSPHSSSLAEAVS